MRLILFIFSIAGFISAGDGSVNYCGSKICGYTDAHTFCRYSPGPSSSCNGYVPSTLSTDEKARVLSRLNKRRNEIAHGLRSFLPAADMLKLRWVDELEREACLWADQCRPPAAVEEHDACRDLYSISVGQCVASVVGEAPGLRPESMVDMWFMQSHYYAGNVTEYMPPTNEIHYYGDFAQMTWSKTYMVGCGRSRFMIPWRGRLRSVERLVCNFAPRGPSQMLPLWIPGFPASACPPRSYQDFEFNGLCDFQLKKSNTISENNTIDDKFNSLIIDILLELEKNNSTNEIGRFDELYLTAIAIEDFEYTTISNILNTSKIRFARDKGLDNVNIEFKLINKTHNVFNESYVKTNVYERVRNKYNILGRPKSYEIEDLNDPTDQTITNSVVENSTFSVHSTDFDYDEYDVQRPIRERLKNKTSAIEAMRNKLNESAIISYNENFNYTKHTIFNNSSLLANLVDEMISPNDTDFLNGTIVDEHIVDDYLSDPETARELQAAIKQMENKLAPLSTTPKKARREIRESEENMKLNPNILKELRNNITKERGPVVDMVLKYVPYLKQYENAIVSATSTSESSRLADYSMINNNIISFVILNYFTCIKCYVQ